MAWDEPGGRDPWSGRQGEGPPDLDEAVRRMQDRLGKLFGGGGRGPRRGDTGRGRGAYLPIIALLAALALLYEMFYVVQAAELGVVLRFGRYVTTLAPGPSLRLPRPIEYVEKVSADLVQSTAHRASMLTSDENIVDVELEVQYRITDVKAYLFNARGPDDTIRQATEAAVREIVGANTMDFVLTGGRTQISLTTKDALQSIVDQYGTGLQVNVVNIKSAKPPDDVKAAFDDAIKAREDEQRLINEAEAYSNEVIPKARGAAARQIADAEAYRSRVTAQAKGDAARFSQLLEQYRKSPEVTRNRLYIEAMESVLGNTSKVLVEEGAGQSLFYLPLDRLVQRPEEMRSQAPSSSEFGNDVMGSPALPLPERGRDDARDRGKR